MLYTATENEEPCKFVKFTPIDEESYGPSRWTYTENKEEATNSNRRAARFLNCFMVEKNEVVLVLNDAIKFFNEFLRSTKSMSMNAIDDCIQFSTCCNSDLVTSNQAGLLLSFEANPSQSDYTSSYEGGNSQTNSWLVRSVINVLDRTIECEDKRYNSTLLKHEIVT